MAVQGCVRVHHGSNQRNVSGRALPVDVYENEAEILLFLDAPGTTAEGLRVAVENGELFVEAARPKDVAEGNSVLAERELGLSRRVFTVPKTVDTTAIEASLKDGVLNIRLPKSADARPRKIEVKTN